MLINPYNQPARLLRFDVFEIDLDKVELRKEGQIVPLQEKPYQLLTLFLERAGQVVTRDEIIERLWGKDTFIDFDGSLNQAVRKLREALGDSAADHRFIQTVARRGYRFVPPVTTALPVIQAEAGSSDRLQLVQSERKAGRWLTSHRLAAASCLGIAVLLGLPIASWLADYAWRRAEAVRAWRSGMELLRRRNLPAARDAAVELRRAVALHPEFAPAWAGLAEAGVLFLNPLDANGAMEIAERSVRLDPGCGECRGTMGFLLFTRFFKWSEAEDQLRHGLRLRPRDPQIRLWFAQLQAARGRPVECVKLLDEAIRQTPHAFNLFVMKAGCLYFARNYAGVLQTSDRLIAVNHSGGETWRARALFLTGRHREAVRSLAYDLGANTARSPQWIAETAESFERRYDSAGLEGALGDLLQLTGSPHARRVHSFNRAMWFMLLGKHDSALGELELTVATKPPPFDVIYLGVDPLFDRLRSQPKFRDVLMRLGLMASSHP